jgi:hypothetical protein
MGIKYAEQIVAFIDVLGFGALVNKDDHQTLDRYYQGIDHQIKLLKEFKSEIKSIQISDSIILVVPPDEESLKGLVEAIQGIQMVLFEQGLLTRGAVTIGSLNSDIETGRIVGKAFIQAYELEKLAKHPRVLIDPKILNHFDWTRREFVDRFNNKDDEQLIHDLSRSGRFLQDDDLFVSYLSWVIWDAVQSHDAEYSPNESLKKIEMHYSFLRTKIYEEYVLAPKFRWIRDYILEVLMTIEIKMSLDGRASEDARSPRQGLLYEHPVIVPLYNKFLAL